MKEVYERAVNSFKDDILFRDGIQVIPVTDAKVAISFAIIDAIRETVKECNKNAEVRVVENALIEEGNTYSSYDDGVFTFFVDDQSILSIADKLIKEL